MPCANRRQIIDVSRRKSWEQVALEPPASFTYGSTIKEMTIARRALVITH
jgi:hypothetical protein